MTTDIVLAGITERDPVVVDYKAKGVAFLQQAEALVVDSDEQDKAANDLLTDAARLKKRAEDRRTGLVGPPGAWVKLVNELFRGVMAPIVTGDTLLRGKVITYRRNKETAAKAAAAAAEAARLAQEAIEREAERLEKEGQNKAAETLIEKAIEQEQVAVVAQAQAAPPPKTVRTETGQSTTTKRWTFKVTSIGDVPREYLILDEVKVRATIREAVKLNPGVEPPLYISGLEVFQDDGLAVKA